jgi:hypothetical protein
LREEDVPPDERGDVEEAGDGAASWPLMVEAAMGGGREDLAGEREKGGGEGWWQRMKSGAAHLRVGDRFLGWRWPLPPQPPPLLGEGVRRMREGKRWGCGRERERERRRVGWVDARRGVGCGRTQTRVD